MDAIESLNRIVNPIGLTVFGTNPFPQKEGERSVIVRMRRSQDPVDVDRGPEIHLVAIKGWDTCWKDFSIDLQLSLEYNGLSIDRAKVPSVIWSTADVTHEACVQAVAAARKDALQEILERYETLRWASRTVIDVYDGVEDGAEALAYELEALLDRYGYEAKTPLMLFRKNHVEPNDEAV